jgi:transcriptional regulator
VYTPSYHEETNVLVLQALIQAHPLGTWATQGDGELIVNHIPFLLDPFRGEFGTLMGHVARANDVWRSFSKTVPSVVVFQGAESYITPSWYPSKRAHGKAVPTWNYVVVHAQGLPLVVDDKARLLEHLNQLTDVHEAKQPMPWKMADAPVDYTDRLIEHIVGIEIPIDRLVGKWKVSQNRPKADRLGVVAGLLAKEDPESTKMAGLVNQQVPSSDRG